MSKLPLYQTQLRARLSEIVAKSEYALSDAYVPHLSRYREQDKVIERLGLIFKRCTLFNSLLLIPIGTREYNELLRSEIEFIRNAELFLDEMGIQKVPEASK